MQIQNNINSKPYISLHQPGLDCTLTSVYVLQGMSSVFFNKGENCIAAGRLFVEDTIHDHYLKRVASTWFAIGETLISKTTVVSLY